MNGYLLLLTAIACEVFATSMMRASEGFSKLIPSIVFVVGIGTSFYMLSQALTHIPLSIAYAIWSGLGTALTALIAVLVWKETFTIYTLTGIALIITGVILLNLKGAGH